MQFSSVLVAAAALAVAKAAQFTNTPAQFVGVATGTPFDLTWSNATGPVTLLLKNGASTDLKTVETIASMYSIHATENKSDFHRWFDRNFVQLDPRILPRQRNLCFRDR